MRVTVEFSYLERGVVPPRCRRPRDVWHDETTAVEVREVSAADAPIAFRVREPIRGTWPARWHGERLYALYRPWAHQQEVSRAGSRYFPPERRDTTTRGLSRDDALAALRDWAESFLVVDGVVWQQVGEPRYVVMTFGLGHNHGGTALLTDTGYNPNIAAGRYFRADQFREARASAVATAERRGDSNDIPGLRRLRPPIRVVIASAVRCQPDREHGDGDPFLNAVHAISEAAPDAATAGLLTIAHTLRELEPVGVARGGERR